MSSKTKTNADQNKDKGYSHICQETTFTEGVGPVLPGIHSLIKKDMQSDTEEVV